MKNQEAQPLYLEDLFRRHWLTWIGSGLTAIGMNLALFLLMPHLIDPAPNQSSIETLIPQVHFIRMKRPDTPVKKKTEPPPEKPKPKPIEKPSQVTHRPLQRKLALPFEINPRLPSGPNTLLLPPLASAPLSNLKGVPDAFSLGDLDAPLTVIARTPPVYPMRAKRKGIEGWVRVQFIVDENGFVNNVKILETHPSDIFNQSVHRCVSRWRFKPGTIEGMPVKALVETTVRFELEG